LYNLVVARALTLICKQNTRIMNNGIQCTERQLKKYTNHAFAPCVAKHFLYTLIIYRLKFTVSRL